MDYDTIMENVLSEIEQRKEDGFKCSVVYLSPNCEKFIDNYMIRTFQKKGCILKVNNTFNDNVFKVE